MLLKIIFAERNKMPDGGHVFIMVFPADIDISGNRQNQCPYMYLRVSDLKGHSGCQGRYANIFGHGIDKVRVIAGCHQYLGLDPG